ncbi:MAG TPA: rod shape-determining protein MreD [Longimicrobium sp.]|jgi:cell shape-determining protein MreD
MTEGTRWQFVGLIAGLVILHFVLRVGLALGFFVPDLLTVALLLAARRMRAGWAAGLGVLFGVLDGAVNPFTMGASALVLAVLGYLAARSREVLAGDSPVLLLAFLGLGKYLFDVFLYGVLVSRGLAGPASVLFTLSPLAALYAAAAGLAAVTVYRALV